MVASVTAVRRRFTTAGATQWPPEASIGACAEAGRSLLARPRAHARHHWAALPVADAAGEHRVPPSAPSVGLTVDGGGRRSSPRQTPGPLLCPPLRALRPRRAAVRLGRRAVAGSSPRSRRGLGRREARYACPPGRVRPIDRAAAGVWRARGAPPGALPCRPRGAPAAGGRTPPHPRARPGAAGAPQVHPRGWARGGSRAVFLRSSRPPRPGRRARRAPRRRAPNGGVPAGPALGHAERAAPAGRHRPATVPLAHSARPPGPTRRLVETQALSRVAHPGSVGGPARDVRAPRGARPPRPPTLPHPPDPPGDHAPRRGKLPCRRPRRAVPPAVAGRDLPTTRRLKRALVPRRRMR